MAPPGTCSLILPGPPEVAFTQKAVVAEVAVRSHKTYRRTASRLVDREGKASNTTVTCYPMTPSEQKDHHAASCTTSWALSESNSGMTNRKTGWG